MRTLFLLSVLVCAVEPWWIFTTFFDGFSSRYPFLRDAKWEARREFSDIISNTTMKRGQREDALDQWAEKHGLSEDYKKYKNATDIAREERHKALMDILEKLPVFFAKLESIETDKSLTCDEENESIRKLCTTVDARGRRAADYLLGLYRVQPHYTVKPKRASSFHDLILEDLANSAVDVEEFFTW